MACIVCFRRKPDMLLLPCRHLSLCQQCVQQCALRSTRCPLCRVDIQQKIQVINACIEDEDDNSAPEQAQEHQAELNALAAKNKEELSNHIMFMDAITNGKTEVVMFLHQLPNFRLSDSSKEDACKLAAERGYLELLRYLHENAGYPVNSSTCYKAASSGKLQVLQYLCNNECVLDEHVFVRLLYTVEKIHCIGCMRMVALGMEGCLLVFLYTRIRM